MQLNPYLVFNGQCRAALAFYEQCLDGQVEVMTTYGETPAAEHVPPTERFGMLVDRFGIPWMVNCEKAA